RLDHESARNPGGFGVPGRTLTDRAVAATLRCSSRCSAQALDDHRHALAAADAHRLQGELLVVELQRVDQRGGDPGARHAEGVADGDGAAVDVQLLQRDAEVAVGGDHLGGERLVDLDQV